MLKVVINYDGSVYVSSEEIGMFSITLGNCRFTKANPLSPNELLLGVEGGLSVEANGQKIFDEPESSPVEFRVALGEWLVGQGATDFIFASAEADERELIWFKRGDAGEWTVGSAWMPDSHPSPVSRSELVAGVTDFVESVDAWVATNLGDQSARIVATMSRSSL